MDDRSPSHADPRIDAAGDDTAPSMLAGAELAQSMNPAASEACWF